MQTEDKLNNKKAFSWMKNSNKIEPDNIQDVMHADIVIIGAWQAGTCAARAASEFQDLKTVVIEQQSQDNQFILGVGEVGHINSQWQKS